MKAQQNAFLYICFLCLALVFAFACEDDHHDDAHDHAEESIEAEACEHIVSADQELMVTASATRESASPINAEHKRVVISLSDMGDQWVSYEVSTAGTYLFFLNQSFDAQIVDAQGNELATTPISTTFPCTDVVAGFELSFDVGTYFIKWVKNAQSTEPSQLYLVSEEK
jgi:hypothetical protein